MKCLSFNCRGLASPPKKLALQRLFEVEQPDIILLQETLGHAENVTLSLQALAPKWKFMAFDAIGRSGGLAIGTNPRTLRIEAAWGGLGFLGIDIFSSELGKSLRILNVYGPCHQREFFWRRLLNFSLLAQDHTILGGDLNFSLGFSESWGHSAQVDAITEFMRNILDQKDFIDVPMQKPQPTWRNRRVGTAALARRLDRFLMKGPLLQHFHHYKQWEFIKLVNDFWKAHPIDKEASLAKGFCSNLTLLKHITINWAKEKNRKESEQLTSIEAELLSLQDDRNLGFISGEEKTRLIELENQKANILRLREESNRLRSRAIWLKVGDENTKFFQNYAKGRKVSNTIWNLPMLEGGLANTFNKLSQLGTNHFRSIYKSPPGTNLAEIINLANHFPRFVNEEDAEELTAPVTMDELEGTLKWFKKDKSPRPDGWTIEFYLTFFELLGQDLLRVVEESRSSGCLYHAINSTFIALIPKSDSPSSFDDYRPISLCNCLYKIISKIIANRLRPILSKHIAPQQFAFLEDRQIHEAIGSAQEALHSIWSRHLKCILLKIDLSKAFDRVSWLYIKMFLIHLGFPLALINWIMACIMTPSYSVLINGSASHFFHSERGLRQGCPLSPLLFLLVMEGLSRLIIAAKREGTLSGLRITYDCYLTPLLFVDDVLILLDGNIRDSLTFSRILQLFMKATGMMVNQQKSTITFSRTSVNEAQAAQQAFPFTIHPMDRGLKYLGFWLKPNSKRIADWVWLVNKVEKRLNYWSHRYLSRDGRLVLIKSVLEATPVFWMVLAWIPRNILARLQQICNKYLWAGSQDKCIFAWIGWQKIALPKRWGGWGLKDFPLFAKAMAAKMGWSLLTSQNLWARLSYHKYIWPQDILDWVRLPNWNRTGISSVWKDLLFSLPLIRDNLVWRINDGSLARIGMDRWIGSGGRHTLSLELIQFLHSRDINVIAQDADHENSGIFHQAWISAQQMNLPHRWHQEWKDYYATLTESHIRIRDGPDELIWSQAENGKYSPKAGYITLSSHKKPYHIPTWCQSIWKLTAPPRSKLFFWCVLRDKVPTGEHLMHRSIHGPSWCVMCKKATKSTEHLFLRCSATQELWRSLSYHFSFIGN
eukprot:PITA_09046